MREQRTNRRMKMNSTQIEKLQSLRNYGTAYEVEIRMPNGEKFLLCYIAGKSYSKLYRAAANRFDSLRARFDNSDFVVALPESIVPDDSKYPIITYSGRTQREAIIAGEIPFYKNI